MKKCDFKQDLICKNHPLMTALTRSRGFHINLLLLTPCFKEFLSVILTKIAKLSIGIVLLHFEKTFKLFSSI